MRKLLCLLLAAGLLLAGCGKNDAVEVNADFGGTLSLFAYEDDTINPLKTKYQTNAQVFNACMHRGLLKTKQNLEISCDLAESYTFSQDKTSVTFKLKDMIFSDGSRVLPDDVINSLDTIRQNKESMYHVIFNFVESYEKTNDGITVKLYKPDSGVLSYMNFPVVKEDNGSVLGTGYYKLAEIQSDRVLLSAVSSLDTNFETVRVMMYPKQDMAENAFLGNEIDVINADYYSLARLQAKTGTKLTEYISDDFAFVGFNTKNEILSDINVRRAIACLIDKKSMAETLMAGYVKPVNSPFKPDSVYGNLYAGEYAQNIDLFKEYLKKSDLAPEDLSFKILVNQDSITKTKVAQYLSQRLESAGVSCVVEQTDFDMYINKIQNGEYTLFVGETTVALNQDLSFLSQSGQNVFGYENEELDKLLDKFKFETDAESKKETAKNISMHLVDNVPFISLYYKINTLLTDADIEGDFKPMYTNILSGIEAFKLKK
ncbi:MAG: ABC transporter substrate-binding protein [Clostridia bacterium]|nr:ABC transporter substrate-binding protein [Clostridia bacterium]